MANQRRSQLTIVDVKFTGELELLGDENLSVTKQPNAGYYVIRVCVKRGGKSFECGFPIYVPLRSEVNIYSKKLDGESKSFTLDLHIEESIHNGSP